MFIAGHRYETVSCGIAHTVYRAKQKQKSMKGAELSPAAIKICFFSIQLPTLSILELPLSKVLRSNPAQVGNEPERSG